MDVPTPPTDPRRPLRARAAPPPTTASIAAPAPPPPRAGRPGAPPRRPAPRKPAPLHRLFTAETRELYLQGIDRTETIAKEVLLDRINLIAQAEAKGQEPPFKLTRAEVRQRAGNIRSHLARARAAIEDGRRDRAVAAVREVRKELARIDCASFVEFVIRTEKGRRPITLTPMHREWHAMADGFDRVVIWAHIGSGKSLLLITARTLWELGRDPELRIGIVSETAAKAKKLARPIKAYVESSRELREVFPALRKSLRDGMPWNQSELTVDRLNSAKDASITIVSALKPTIASARLDRVFFDDILSHRTARKPTQQEELRIMMRAEVMGRIEPNGRAIAVNTAWKMGDYMNELSTLAHPDAVRRYGIRDEHGVIRCPWLDEHFIAQKEAELGPVESARQLHVIDREDEDSRFNEEWIRTSLTLGDGVRLVYELKGEERARYIDDGCVIVVGVDVAASKKRAGARTAFTVLLVHPDGEHQVLWIKAGQFTAPEIRDLVILFHHRYGAVVFVETVGVQKWMIDLVAEVSDAYVAPFQTGTNKIDSTYGVTSVGHLMERGKLCLPSNNLVPRGQVKDFLADIRAFHPQKHPGDVLMSLWIAKEGARQLRGTTFGAVGAGAEAALA